MSILRKSPGFLVAMASAAAVSWGAALDTVYLADFQSSQPWTARPGMTLSVIDVAGRSKALRVAGNQQSDWNYVYSGSFALQAGHLYRLTGWVKVDSLNPKNSPPYFKIEFAGISGRVSTSVYDMWDRGWQQLVLEFACPTGVTGGSLALEKGVNSPVFADIDIDDILLTEIDRFSDHPYHFDTVPAVLNARKISHPRLYMTAQSMSSLKAKLTAQPYATLLAHLKSVADSRAASGPPAYTVGTDQEQLWQREVGNAIPHLAMAYCMTGTAKYLDAAKAYMLAAASYPTWGLGSYDNHDLATGHQLYGMALGYDWLFNDLDATSRDSIRSCLVRRGGRLFNLFLHDSVYWADSYLQNHQWVNMTGLSTAGLALYGGSADVDGWILLPLKKFTRAIASLQPDGAGHEGVPYWEYGVEYLLKFMDLSRDLLGQDFFAGSSFFRTTADFRLYAMIPMDFWKASNSRLMSVGDSPRYDWYGPDYLLRKLAAEYGNANAQWLADKLDSAGYCVPGADFLNLLWVNPAIAAQPPTALPTSKHFNDLDVVYLRSGWSGKEALTEFKCGPFIGHNATSLYGYDPGGGHVHPDVGAFQIFAHGDWLISDDGYAFKRTIYQNTLLINGTGQTGEGAAWFNGTLLCMAADQPRIVYTRTGADYDYVIGNAKPAYPVTSHLTSFYRHLLYLKPDCWVVGDEVSADSQSLYEFYYHADSASAFAPDSAGRFNVHGSRGALRLTVLRPVNAATQTFVQDIQATGGGIASRLNALKVSSSGKTSDLFITVAEAYDAGLSPTIKPSIVSSASGDTLIIAMKDTTWRFAVAANRADKRTPLFVDARQGSSIARHLSSTDGTETFRIMTTNGHVRFRVALSGKEPFAIEILSTQGRTIRKHAMASDGIRTIDLGAIAGDLPHGSYLVLLKAGANRLTKRFVY